MLKGCPPPQACTTGACALVNQWRGHLVAMDSTRWSIYWCIELLFYCLLNKVVWATYSFTYIVGQCRGVCQVRKWCVCPPGGQIISHLHGWRSVGVGGLRGDVVVVNLKREKHPWVLYPKLGDASSSTVITGWFDYPASNILDSVRSGPTDSCIHGYSFSLHDLNFIYFPRPTNSFYPANVTSNSKLDL